MKIYFRILAIVYFLGALLHLLDVFNLRLNFSSMTSTWKVWIVFLLIGDGITAIGLLKERTFGEYGFLLIAGVQLLVYGIFPEYFGKQYELIIFHVITISIYLVLKFRRSIMRILNLIRR